MLPHNKLHLRAHQLSICITFKLVYKKIKILISWLFVIQKLFKWQSNLFFLKCIQTLLINDQSFFICISETSVIVQSFIYKMGSHRN